VKKKLLISFVLFSLSSNIWASGFQINEHGSKAMGMGGAFAALANDPSAIYFNPSGITQLYGTQLLFGSTLILPSSTFRGPSPLITESKLESQVFTPIHLYATHQINDNLFLGFGVGNNYGLGTKWEDDWVGRFMAVETEIRTFFFNLAASYKIIPELSIGFGYVFAYGDVLIGRKLNLSPFNSEPSLELEGTGTGSGFTAGIIAHPTKSISLGLSFRSQVTIDFEGEATSSNVSPLFEGRLPNGDITAPLTTPENITFGIAIKPLKNFTLTADYQYVGWDSYKKLEVEFQDFIDSDTGEKLLSTSERNYDNGFIARLGAEYNYNTDLDIYVGFLYDSNPVSDERLDPTLPDADRLGFSAGAGYKLNANLAVEAGYLFLRFDERKISNSLENYSGIENSITPMNGVYNSVAHLISLSLVYNF
jgi:long-chain fatty acid transport protein